MMAMTEDFDGDLGSGIAHEIAHARLGHIKTSPDVQRPTNRTQTIFQRLGDSSECIRRKPVSIP